MMIMIKLDEILKACCDMYNISESDVKCVKNRTFPVVLARDSFISISSEYGYTYIEISSFIGLSKTSIGRIKSDRLNNNRINDGIKKLKEKLGITACLNEG